MTEIHALATMYQMLVALLALAHGPCEDVTECIDVEKVKATRDACRRAADDIRLKNPNDAEIIAVLEHIPPMQ